MVNGVIPASDCKICKDSKDEPKDFEGASLLCALKPRKRKERHESCCQERKLIRYNEMEIIFYSRNYILNLMNSFIEQFF